MLRKSVFRSIAAWRPLAWSLLLVATFAWSGGERTEPPQEEQTVTFALSPQPLAAALAAFSAQTGYSVLVASELAADRRAAGVYGELEPREALRRLLTGSGLVARYSGGNAFSLTPGGKSEPIAAGSEQPALTNLPFGAVLQVSLTRALCRAQPEVFGRYRVGLQLWINEDGRVVDVRLLGSSGDEHRDVELMAELRDLVLDAPPPPVLAQPVTILLTPRPDPAGDCRRLDDDMG